MTDIFKRLSVRLRPFCHKKADQATSHSAHDALTLITIRAEHPKSNAFSGSFRVAAQTPIEMDMDL